jgi:hypothetical protein
METLSNQSMEPNIPSYEDMVKAGMHFGRKKSVFNPKMKPYVYVSRDNIYIIDLIKTREGLSVAMEFLKKSLTDGKLILFIGLSAQSADLVKDLAEGLNMPYVINRWLGGTLTNFKTIISRVHYLESLEKEMALGGFEKYTKKERIMKEKEIAKLPKQEAGIVRGKPLTFYKGKGCEQCGDTGYKGRIGIFEILPVTEKIKGLTLERTGSSVLAEAAIAEGMATLKQDGIMKALEGITTLEEVWRVTKD